MLYVYNDGFIIISLALSEKGNEVIVRHLTFAMQIEQLANINFLLMY